MSADNFERCLAVVLQSEGSFVDDPADPGGATNLGVTLATLSGWLGHTATISDVEALTPASVAPIYRTDFWNVCHCDDLPDGVDLMVFDEAVNSGPGRARRALQTAAGVTADGSIGPATEAAVRACKPGALIDALANGRDLYYRSLPRFSHFGNGWLSRVNRTAALAHQMVGK